MALAAIIVLGPRFGRSRPGAVPIRGHDLPVTTIGVFVLWVGWYGFNGGSTLGLTAEVPSVILNTTLAAAFGGMVGLTLTWLLDRRPDVVVIDERGAGLAGRDHRLRQHHDRVEGCADRRRGPPSSCRVSRSGSSDSTSTTPSARCPVHLGAGIWGTVAVGLPRSVDSFPEASGRLEQLGIQLVGIGTCFVWSFALGYVVLSLIDRRFPFRVDPEGEIATNIAEHGVNTQIGGLLADMDEQRRSGDFARPLHVEPNTEVGQIAAEYNRVLAAIERRTESLQLLRHTTAAANESSSVEEALAVALEEVGRLSAGSIG